MNEIYYYTMKSGKVQFYCCFFHKKGGAFDGLSGGEWSLILFRSDTWIDPCIGKVCQQIDEYKQERSQDHESLQCLQIGTVQSIDSPESESWDSEETFEEQTSREEKR